MFAPSASSTDAYCDLTRACSKSGIPLSEAGLYWAELCGGAEIAVDGVEVGIDAAEPARRIAVGVGGGDVPPVRELRAITRRHVVQVARHLERQVVGGGDLGVRLLQLREMLLQLVVAEQSVVIVRRVVDDSAAELGRSGADRRERSQARRPGSSFSRASSFLSLRDLQAWCDSCSQAVRGRLTDRL